VSTRVTTETRVRAPRRFLPPDPTVTAPYRLSPQLALRIGVLGAVALVVFAVLFLRLWALQVLSGEEYLRAAQNNQLRTIRLDAPRGTIVDRDGRVLVTNRPATVVRIWPADLPKKGAYDVLRRLSGALDVPLARITREIERRRGDPVTPVIVKTGVSDAQALFLIERQRDFRGVDVHPTYLRQYPRGVLGAHLFGYVGEISSEQLESRAKAGFRPGDRIGQGGLEKAYDAYLRGRPGLAELRVDSRGKPKGAVTRRLEPQAGNALRVTIDLGLQRAAERSLREWIRRARYQDCVGCWAANGGAIVALDPRDGAVLALASFPTYDPRLYTGRVDLRQLTAAGLTQPTAAEKNFPAINRVTQGTYPPGSTFKPVTALAAMQEHLISPYSPLLCSGSYEVAGQRFKNWNPDVYEMMTLPTALEASCDTYFYQVGKMFYDLPPQRRHPLQEWAARFGFGKPTGIDVGPELKGLLPTPEWRKAAFDTELDRAWKPGDSIQLAIGQKDLQVTPLQMARFYAMVANGGRLVTPYVGIDVEEAGDDLSAPDVLRRFEPPPSQPTGVDPAALAVVQQGLFQATHGSNGTATSVFGSFPVDIAGKTGTAEKVMTLPGWDTAAPVDQSWWCGYGPVEEPKIVVCSLIENGGHGGTAAAPAALRVFEEYFGAKAAYELPSVSD
jgi:penicillin-binding protein 2